MFFERMDEEPDEDREVTLERAFEELTDREEDFTEEGRDETAERPLEEPMDREDDFTDEDTRGREERDVEPEETVGRDELFIMEEARLELLTAADGDDLEGTAVILEEEEDATRLDRGETAEDWDREG